LLSNYELISNQAVQVNPQKEPSTSTSKTGQGGVRNSIFGGKNLTIEKLKLIIFCQMYK